MGLINFKIITKLYCIVLLCCTRPRQTLTVKVIQNSNMYINMCTCAHKVNIQIKFMST